MNFVLILYGLNILIFILALLWILVPVFYGLPAKPTSPDRIRRGLKLAGLQPHETLYDLGAGDGRVLIIAAKEFGAQAVGLEVGPMQIAVSWLRVLLNGIRHKVRIEAGNYYKAEVSEADVVYVYATSREVRKLAPLLESQMKRGSRLVSISADFPKWEPSIFDEQDLIFIYTMPPKDGSLTTYLLKKAD
jgi:hypothetical protein